MSDKPQISSRIGAILRATSGNFLEQFDFFLFGFYAGPISKAFFPSVNEYKALMLTFTTGCWRRRRSGTGAGGFPSSSGA